ncbi:MAG: O-methyltransferase [Ignavibacteriae bacterium]|nr:O-methyltransferase [Ignavibacteriota bacterium]
MDIVNSYIVEYLLNVTPERDEILEDMEQYALARNFPVIGPLVGRLLYALAKATQAERILELGSGFGYSAYWFAKALGKNGEVICTEGNPDNAEHAQVYFHRGKIANKVKFLVGDALKLIDEVDGQFDIIFNDIDKHQYPKAFRKAVPRLRKGGLLISDNVLWSGRILDRRPDADTAGILTYNRLIYSSKELFTTIIPLRDGVSISIKL